MSGSRLGPDGKRGTFTGSAFLAESAAMQHRGRADPPVAAALRAGNDEAVQDLGAGRTAAAVAVLERLVLDCRGVLGERHPETLIVEGNLAVAYLRHGQEQRGVQIMAANLAAREAVLGQDHVHTLNARDALAAAYRLTDRIDESLALYEQVVDQRGRRWGFSHPDTLVSRWGLGLSYAQYGDLDRAVALVAAAAADAVAGRAADVLTRALQDCVESLMAETEPASPSAGRLDPHPPAQARPSSVKTIGTGIGPVVSEL